ncbi:MAG TPA: cytochrome b/b6 domain-containing protein [Prolixibacteraceae bacterium]|nr:cytochrome b/b6 domain-containing protein [Prolixibacteraceae bacterium]
MTTEKLYFYPVWLRVWHGFNALGILVLIVTGISMQWSIDSPLINFSLAVKMHNIAGVVVSIGYLLFFAGNLFTVNGKFYRVKPKGLGKRLVRQARYYLCGMFKNEEPPFPLSEKRKFNPLQKYSYILVMYLLMPLVVITGLALLFPELIIEEVYHLSGIFLTAVFHSALGFLISIFLIVHLYVASIGKNPLKNYRSIVTGWHEINH